MAERRTAQTAHLKRGPGRGAQPHKPHTLRVDKQDKQDTKQEKKQDARGKAKDYLKRKRDARVSEHPSRLIAESRKPRADSFT